MGAKAELEALADYALDLDRPDIVCASAVDLLRDFADQNVVERVRALLVRPAAASPTRNLASPLRVALLKPLLTDPVRAVRRTVTQELLADDTSAIATSAEEKTTLERALAEYRRGVGRRARRCKLSRERLSHLPGSINLLFEMAGQASARGDDATAVEWYRRVLDADGSQRTALAGRGIPALRVGDYDLATEVTAKLLSLEPANTQAYAKAR
ncbi:hypothetical protein HT585_23870 [Ensifer sp. HO-A22]|uniref:Tetratricopeptide repeat protein n=1 Tax=Ensifer oleiphilus TaxID=2742698 RepID=A0A7Y6UPZ2_9HYPH|nr:hypothetical protein [Ensifer oleiphilus]NVD41910.1 hypothetical protein [Ensifer oleiphilus]